MHGHGKKWSSQNEQWQKYEVPVQKKCGSMWKVWGVMTTQTHIEKLEA